MLLLKAVEMIPRVRAMIKKEMEEEKPEEPKWVKVRIRFGKIFNPKYSSSKCIVVKDVVLWSPPGKEELKYPFLRGEYLYCSEWGRGGVCLEYEDYVPEGSIIYCTGSTGSAKHVYGDTYLLMRVEEGGKVEHEQRYMSAEGENISLIADWDKIHDITPELRLFAKKEGYNISRTREIDNLVALLVMKEGLLKERTTCEAKMASACGV